MSFAILQLCGVEGAAPSVAPALLACLFKAAKLRKPLDQFVLTVTSEHAELLLRAEAIERYQSLGLFSLARKLGRQKTRRGELLIVAIDDNGVRFKTLGMAAIRAAFAGMDLGGKNGCS
jgi:hypothetical protein